MIGFGWMLLVPGIVLTPLPPPFTFGIFLLVPGLAILIAYSKDMRRLVQALRARWGLLDRVLNAWENRVPGWMGRSLKRTNPGPVRRARFIRRARKTEAGQ